MSTKEKSKLPDTGLRQLLDDIQLVHSNDIATYTGGHLNESKLWKPPEETSHKSWKSALKPNLTVVPPSALPKKIDLSKARKIQRMKDSFTCYTTGMLSARDKPNSSEQVQDSVYVEELKPGNLKLDKSGKKAKGWSKDSPLEPLNQLSYKDAITKKDQYQAIMQFKEDFIRKSPRGQQKTSGDSTVDMIEDRLDRKLDSMPHGARGTNFHRVQAFGSAFEELVDNSQTFGYMLKTIKNEYDAYLSYLLDSQMGKHKDLQTQVSQLSSRGSPKSEVLQHQIDEVNKLESEARAVLEENDRLRRELEKEQEKTELLSTTTDLESSKDKESTTTEEKHSSVTNIEELNSEVLDKLDEVKRIRTKLHQDYVPAIVCNHLEQCIKDTEVEMQRLATQKEYFNNTIAETEENLQQAVEHADTTEKDSMRIWEKVKVDIDEDGNLIKEDPIDDIDEDAKWCWYIS